MSVRRVIVAGALAACVWGWPLAPATAADEPPGPVGLELKVDRLGQARQADVVGSSASAMLFAPSDTAAIAVATDARTALRAAEAGALFLRPPVPARPPVSADLLFGPGSVLGGSGARVAPGEARGEAPAGVPPALLVLGALLVCGSALSSVVRERLEVAGE